MDNNLLLSSDEGKNGTPACAFCGASVPHTWNKYCSHACYSQAKRDPNKVRLEKCAVCGRPVPRSGTKYCSHACYAESKRYTHEERLKQCERCGKTFEISAYHWRTRYCSLDCAHQASVYSPILTKTCLACGVSFETKKAKRKYCSPDCKKEHQRARWALLSPEQRVAEVGRLHGITEYTSGIEKRLHVILDQWRVEYVTQFLVRHCYTDLYIPRLNLIVEVFGCYWHACPRCGYGNEERREYDARRASEIIGDGYRLAVIWERDIRRDAEETLQAAFRAVQQQTA